jgi:hypothetical protein
MSRTIKPAMKIQLDGVDMEWDGAGSRYFCLQSIDASAGNAKVAVVYREVGGDYPARLTSAHEIMRDPLIISHARIKIRPGGASAFILGATRSGDVRLSDDIPGWVGKP